MKLRHIIIPLAVLLYGLWTFEALWVGVMWVFVSWAAFTTVVGVNVTLFSAFMYGGKVISYIKKRW